ncbi:MAG: NADH-quinone oxidoreductase subunit M [Candidatus Protochlamydia sp.]|nr:NADH-quinone oxidoreductase subunit M [Candidatus Protochlamydia sp.]
MPSSMVMWLFGLPLAASAVLFTLPVNEKRTLKSLAVFFSFVPLLMLLATPGSGEGSNSSHDWFPAMSIQFALGIDSLSLIFVYLTALVVPITILAADRDIPHPHLFYGLILFLQGLLIGFFTSSDLLFFTIFWESMLLPLYFIISLWGGAKRRTAALKFILYMFAGSILMIAAVLALYLASVEAGAPTFNIEQLASFAHSSPYAKWLAAFFLLAFAVKIPLFPFHGWLPETYFQASTSGTVLLSALLSKAGVYGILRICLGLFPDVINEWSPWLLGLAIAGVMYGALAAWKQSDFKRLLAYSSFSHVNFLLVGLFISSEAAREGAILQAVNHGITITALFLSAGWLAERIGTTDIGPERGLARYMPRLCWVTLFFVLSSAALPGTNNFVGELLIFFGLFSLYPWLTGFLGLIIILSVVYLLRWMQKVYFEDPGVYQERWVDLTRKELVIAIPLIGLILWIGLYPMGVLKHIEPTVEKIAFLKGAP